MFKNVGSQKCIFFAFDSTTNLPKTGDGANITPYRSLDQGTVTVLGTTTATELDSTNAKGYYSCVLTQAETNGDCLLLSAKSSTANVVVIGAPAVIYLDPPNYTKTSVDSNGRLDIINVNGTAQTARDLGASVLLSAGTGTGQLDFTSGVVKGNAVQILGTAVSTPATAGILDVNVKNMNNVAGTAITTIKAVQGLTTADTITTCTTATNLTNAPTNGDFTATMKTSIGTAVAASAVASVTAGVTLAANALNAASVNADTGLIVRASTATASGAATLTLDASASATDGFYVDDWLVITSGTGVGQSNRISGYVGSTKVATVSPAWVTTPSATSKFSILPAARVDVDAILGTASAGAAGYMGPDWGHVNAPTTTVGLSGTTVGTVTTTTTATNLTNAPTNGDLTATMKTSVTTAATAATPAAASVTGAVGSVTGNVGGNVNGNVVGSVGSVTGLTASNVGAIKTVTDKFAFTVANQVDANALSVSGTAQTARDLGASVLLSAGTGTGQLDFTSGVVKANLAQILGTALTETAGQIAAAFKKFFNIATPASTMDHLTLIDTVTTATTATNLTNAPTAGDLTATMKTSVTTAATAATPTAAAVTGAVGSVTGNVGGSVGSVTGAVGSVTGITASNIGAIKTQTDKLTFTVAGQVDSNTKSMNGSTVNGSGTSGDLWRGS